MLETTIAFLVIALGALILLTYVVREVVLVLKTLRTETTNVVSVFGTLLNKQQEASIQLGRELAAVRICAADRLSARTYVATTHTTPPVPTEPAPPDDLPPELFDDLPEADPSWAASSLMEAPDGAISGEEALASLLPLEDEGSRA